MTRGQTGWLLLLFAAFCLIIIGIQGSLGIAIAIVFSPGDVVLTEGGNVLGSTTGGSAGRTFGGG